MRACVSVLLWAVLGSSLGCGAPVEPETATLAVVGGSLIDGTGAEQIPDGIVLVRAGRVVSAGAAGRIAVPEGASVLDAAGGTILPGLIDAHVHLSSALDRDPGSAAAWLRAGVTTLVDMGSPDGVAGLRRRLGSLPPPTPRVLAAGPILTAPGGYPFVGPRSSAAEVAGPDGARALLGELLTEEGADHVKVALERGFPAALEDEGWPVPGSELLQAIADTAHRAGRRVSVHVTQASELAAAVAAGLDNAAHTPVDPIPDELLRAAAARGVVLVSTASLWRETPANLAVVGRNLRRYLELGGRVALGTDAPAFQEPGLPGEEIRLLLAAGLTPMQVLLAATRDAAFVCGREAELGTLEPGKLADLVVVDGDPLADGLRLDRISAVLLGGAPVAPIHPRPTSNLGVTPTYMDPE